MTLLTILAFVVALAGLAFCCLVGFIAYRRKQYAHIPGPPITSFFMGHANEFKKNSAEGGKATDQLILDWHKQYGKVMCVWFLHQPVLSVCDPDLVKYVLITRNAPKSKVLYDEMASVFGVRCLKHGLFTETDNENWSKDRKVMNPAFHRQCLKDMMGAFNASADLLVEKLLKSADGKTEVSMQMEFSKVTLDVICKVGFGMKVDLINDSTNTFPDAVTEMMEGLQLANFHPYARIDPRCWSDISKFKSSLNFVRETGRKAIEFRQLALNHGEQVPNDILQHILALPGNDIEKMLDHFVTFFIAGHETTAGKMSFMTVELAQHPDILEKLVEEVIQVLGDRKTVEFDDLAKLQLLGHALKETLRLYPTAQGTMRDVKAGEMLGDVKVPCDTSVMLSPYVMGRHPQYWDSPEDFNPDRFDDPEIVKRSHYTTFPFSVGPRNCIGQTFAQIEAKVVFARFLQTLKFKLVPGQNPKKIAEKGSLRPQDGALVYLEKRN